MPTADTMKAWRMKEQCGDCPFATKGPGHHLRVTLERGRWREIQSALERDGHFLCHKTTDETGDGSNLLCAGAIEWQEKRGLSSQLVRIAERLEYIAASRKEAS